MKWSFKIARIGGIVVQIHVTFFLLLAWMGWQYYMQGGWNAATQGVLFTLALFFCVLLHEFGHAFTAKAFGIQTPDITLLPIGGVARLQRMPENPLQELAIAVAGPMVNVVIAIILFLISGAFHPSGMAAFEKVGGSFLIKLLDVNIFLVVFNMIPAFPMDGGRVLRALLAIPFGYPKATKIAARIGQGLAVIFALIGYFGIPGILSSNPILVFIAFFVFFGAQQENVYFQMRGATQGMRVRDLMMERFRCLSAESTLQESMRSLLSDTQPVYPVVGSTLELLGLVDREMLTEAAQRNSESTPVGEIMVRNIPSASPEMPLSQAMEMMQAGYPVLPVLNPQNQIVGLISISQLANFTALSKNKLFAQ